MEKTNFKERLSSVFRMFVDQSIILENFSVNSYLGSKNAFICSLAFSANRSLCVCVFLSDRFEDVFTIASERSTKVEAFLRTDSLEKGAYRLLRYILFPRQRGYGAEANFEMDVRSLITAGSRFLVSINATKSYEDMKGKDFIIEYNLENKIGLMPIDVKSSVIAMRMHKKKHFKNKYPRIIYERGLLETGLLNEDLYFIIQKYIRGEVVDRNSTNLIQSRLQTKH